jgi:hypothetical protein
MDPSADLLLLTAWNTASLKADKNSSMGGRNPQRSPLHFNLLLQARAHISQKMGKLDVAWRRVEKGSPTYVFEVQIGGDLYHAIGKLKHAHDLWNSNIFLVTTKNDVARAKDCYQGHSTK